MAVRALSILLTWVVIGVLLYLLASVLLPELYKSVLQLVSNAETYYWTISDWVQHLLETNPALETWVAAQMDGIYADISHWVKTDMLPQAQILMLALSGGVFSVVGFFGDLLVGIIVSVYFLATKERCCAYAKKVIYGLFSLENVKWILRGAGKVDRNFLRLCPGGNCWTL